MRLKNAPFIWYFIDFPWRFNSGYAMQLVRWTWTTGEPIWIFKNTKITIWMQNSKSTFDAISDISFLVSIFVFIQHDIFDSDNLLMTFINCLLKIRPTNWNSAAQHKNVTAKMSSLCHKWMSLSKNWSSVMYPSLIMFILRARWVQIRTCKGIFCDCPWCYYRSVACEILFSILNRERVRERETLCDRWLFQIVNGVNGPISTDDNFRWRWNLFAGCFIFSLFCSHSVVLQCFGLFFITISIGTGDMSSGESEEMNEMNMIQQTLSLNVESLIKKWRDL